MTFDQSLAPPGIAVSSSGGTPAIPEKLRSAFDSAVFDDREFGLLPLAQSVGKLTSSHIDTIAAWVAELDGLVSRNARLAQYRTDLFLYLLARHRLALDEHRGAKS